MHSRLDMLQQTNSLQVLQTGSVECFVGVILLLEGLDLLQVLLVAVWQADTEGFLHQK